MTPVFAALSPLFVGPSAFLLVTLLALVLLLLVVRVIFGLALKLVVVGAVVLGLLWLLGAVGSVPPLG